MRASSFFVISVVWLMARSAFSQELPGSSVSTETLPVGTVVVEVRDFEGAPAPQKVVVAVIQDSSMNTQERKAVSDETGICRFSDLPVDSQHQVAFFFVDAGMTLAQTAPMHLPSDAGRRVLMRLPEVTQTPEKVEIRTYRAIFSKNHGLIAVDLYLSLATPPGVLFRSASGYRIGLPKGAFAPSVSDEDAREHTRIEADAVYVLQPLTPEGLELEIHFEMQPKDGRLEYEHRLPGPLDMAQLISTWTEAPATLEGEGMPEADLREMQSGLVALVTMSRDIKSGIVRGTLSGLNTGAREAIRLVVLFVSAALIVLGVAMWLRDAGKRAGA